VINASVLPPSSCDHAFKRRAAHRSPRKDLLQRVLAHPEKAGTALFCLQPDQSDRRTRVCAERRHWHSRMGHEAVGTYDYKSLY
jgi:hypothetical protein